MAENRLLREELAKLLSRKGNIRIVGTSPFSPQVLEQVIARQANQLSGVCLTTSVGLSRREQQLIPLIARGLTNKEIAVQLHICEQTVKNHIHRMLNKLGVCDRLNVVAVYRTHGFNQQTTYPDS